MPFDFEHYEEILEHIKATLPDKCRSVVAYPEKIADVIYYSYSGNIKLTERDSIQWMWFEHNGRCGIKYETRLA